MVLAPDFFDVPPYMSFYDSYLFLSQRGFTIYLGVIPSFSLCLLVFCPSFFRPFCIRGPKR